MRYAVSILVRYTGEICRQYTGEMSVQGGKMVDLWLTQTLAPL